MNFFSISHFNGRALLSPCAATILPSRRSLQHVQEKLRSQLEYPPFFRVPVTDGVMFLTGDDTTMIDDQLFFLSTIKLALYHGDSSILLHLYISSNVIQLSASTNFHARPDFGV